MIFDVPTHLIGVSRKRPIVVSPAQSKVSASPSTEQDLVLFGPENFAKNSRLVSSKVGELLGDEPQLLELKTKNNRYGFYFKCKFVVKDKSNRLPFRPESR